MASSGAAGTAVLRREALHAQVLAQLLERLGVVARGHPVPLVGRGAVFEADAALRLDVRVELVLVSVLVDVVQDEGELCGEQSR